MSGKSCMRVISKTENEIDAIRQYGYDAKYWSHHHNPRTVANNPSNGVTVHLTGVRVENAAIASETRFFDPFIVTSTRLPTS